jgi:hypothetical protein
MNPLRVALYINIIVLTPLTTLLLINDSKMSDAYGLRTTSRDILLSIYLTFLFFSIYFLISSTPNDHIKILLFIQIIYKVLSSITATEKCNPVIISNIIVAFVFSILILIYKDDI